MAMTYNFTFNKVFIILAQSFLLMNVTGFSILLLNFNVFDEDKVTI